VPNYINGTVASGRAIEEPPQQEDNVGHGLLASTHMVASPQCRYMRGIQIVLAMVFLASCTSTSQPSSPGPSNSPGSRPAPCGTVQTKVANQDSAAFAYTLPTVLKVHAAACEHDYDAIEKLMEDPFTDARGDIDPPRAREVLSKWRRQDPSGSYVLARLAEVLETSPISDQGGVTYRKDNAEAAFARGTLGDPRSVGAWTTFFLN
jgi:hypothetical protein